VGKWTKKRKKALNRKKDGKFGPWKGGRKKSEMAKKENTFQGIKVHIGKEYKRQHGKIAKIGSMVRKKKKDGTYHKGAYWYIRTKKGWRRATMGKPSVTTKRKIMNNAR